ncbi:hypothetical protein PENTCL1PPCAC_15543, partial [Pristionchus entomophagus]
SKVIRDVKTQVAISSQIDRTLQKDQNEDQQRVKILLLGSADAGKSTILKQMRILHMNGFDIEEMHSFKKHLRFNVFQIFHEVAIGVHDCVPNIPDDEKNVIVRFAEGLSWINGMDENKEIDILLNFRQMDCVCHFMKQYPNYSSLPDNAHYYLPNLASLLSTDYTPTAEDILHLRVPTASVNEIYFSFNSTKIRLIDVGGQRAYRKKWIHCFEGVSAVLFVASMAAYDQSLDGVDSFAKPVLHKDLFPAEHTTPKVGNRMRDSAQLFGEMLRSPYLISSAFILFLNKTSTCRDTVSFSTLHDPISISDGSNEQDASEYLKEYFLMRKSKKDVDRKIYSHFTCATDTKNVDFVFTAACDIVLQKSLNKGGFQ